EERADAIRRNALALGWNLSALEEAGKLFILEARLDRNAILSGDFTIAPLLAIVQGAARRIKAKRIVVDAIDVLLRIYADPRRQQNELYGLHDWLTENGFTTVLTAKKSESQERISQYEFLDYMADCVIALDLRVLGQVTTRRLRVVKYRGSGFASNEYPYVIGDEGNVLMPISTVSLDHRALGPRISTGNEVLDEVLCGGYRRSSSIMITGASGTGKTTLACTFVKAACGRGEKVLYISFEESDDAVVTAMLSPGIDLRPAVKAGTLEFQTVMPEAMGAEQHLVRAFRQIDKLQPDHIVVDAISACKRMGMEKAAFDYLMRLVDLCKCRGITCLMTNQLEGFQPQSDFSGIGFSSLLDAIILLRYVELRREIARSLLVLKSRGSEHSNKYHHFVITDDGIRITSMPGATKVKSNVGRPSPAGSRADDRDRQSK
ncbi:MAG: hypothetical protein A2Y76_11115, partial [Planctomycetes bacterium RBG_13_60_9]